MISHETSAPPERTFFCPWRARPPARPRVEVFPKVCSLHTKTGKESATIDYIIRIFHEEGIPMAVRDQIDRIIASRKERGEALRQRKAEMQEIKRLLKESTRLSTFATL